MNRITQLTLVAFGCVVLFISCSKSSDSVPDNPAVNMSALINGSSWTSTLGGASIVYDTAHGTEKLILGGTTLVDTVTTAISISIDSCTGVGTYKITAAGAVQATYLLHTVSLATSGWVTIQKYSNTQVKGTFYFYAGTTNISAGSFNLHVQ